MLGAQHRAQHEILYVQAPMSKVEEGPHKGPHFLETHLHEGSHGRLSFFITEKRLARSQPWRIEVGIFSEQNAPGGGKRAVLSDSSMLPLSVLSARAFIWRAVPISLMRRSASDLTAAVIMTSADSAKREHLLFDAGFPQKIMITLAGLTFVGALFSPHLNLLLQRFLARLECWSLLGLLSSSCCVLQLVLNVFSVGCAGFNTVLGPARPYFVALTMYLQSVVWRQASLKPVDRLVATALCAVLTTLPEQLWVWQRRDRWLSWRRNCGVIAAEGKQLHLRVSGMGCTACTAKVYTTLSAVDGVDACDVALESGTATLRLQADVLAPAEVEQKAIDAVIAAGFRAERI